MTGLMEFLGSLVSILLLSLASKPNSFWYILTGESVADVRMTFRNDEKMLFIASLESRQ